MRKALSIAFLVALAAPAFGQSPPFPQSLPSNTVVGNTGPVAGPARAVSIATLGSLITSVAETAVSDSDYSVAATDRSIVYTSLSTNRTVNLRAAASYLSGTRITLWDRSGNASSSASIFAAPAGADTINGAASRFTAVSNPYTNVVLESDGVSKWTATLQLSAGAPNSLLPLLSLTQTQAGTTAAAEQFWNHVFIQSDIAAVTGASNEAFGFLITHNFGPSSVSSLPSTLQGARVVFGASGGLSAPSSSSNLLKEYVGIKSLMHAYEPDGGTDLASNAKGALYGFNAVITADAPATNLLELTGGEINTGMTSGSSVSYKGGWTIVQLGSDAVQGNSFDCGLCLSNQAGAVGWKDVILVGNMNGVFPGTSSGNLLRTIGGTLTNGIDISNTTISAFAWHSNAASIDGAGNAIFSTFNKVTITAPATSATLTIANGKTLTVSNTLTFTGTDSTSFAFPAASDTVAGLGTAQTFTKQNQFNAATTVVTAAGASLDDLLVPSNTTTFTGTTTTNAASKVRLQQPTFTDASAATLTDAATLTIANAPTCTGSLTCTNKLALNVADGDVRLGSTSSRLLPGAYNGSFITNTAQIYTSSANGLTLAMGSGATNDGGMFAAAGGELFVNPHASSDIRLGGGGGHLRIGTLAPTLTSCGTSPSITGSDIAGIVTMGTGTPTGCVITFHTAYTGAPFCDVNWMSNLASMSYTVSNTAITLTQTATSSNSVTYHCYAQSAG